PEEKIVVAPANDSESQRTYESAVAVARALRVRGIHPKCLNVFTLGPHARRSRLVFAKVFGPETKVGVIAWEKADYDSMPWWRSSERARELIPETAGYFFEVLLNSRRSSSPARGFSSPGFPPPSRALPTFLNPWSPPSFPGSRDLPTPFFY